MNRKRLFLGLVIGIAAMGKLWSADFFTPTEIGVTAETLGMGRIEGMNSNASTVFENPAGLYRIPKGGVSYFTVNFLSELTYNTLAGAMRTPWGVFGIGYMATGIDGIPQTGENEFGEFYQTGIFGYSNQVAKLSYARPLMENLYAGGSVGLFRNRIASSVGTGYNFDLGLILLLDRWTLSMAQRNIVSALNVKYNNGSQENLPLESVYGASYQVADPLEIMAQAKTVSSKRGLLKSGGVRYTPWPFVSFSGGYSELFVLQEIKNAWSLGVSLRVYGVGFYYAYEKSNQPEFSDQHYFSMAVNF